MIFFYSFCKLKYSFCFCCLVAKLCPTLFVTPWTVACQTPLSMEFFRQEYWSGEPFPSPGIFPTQGSNPSLLHCRWSLYHLGHQGSPAQVHTTSIFPHCLVWNSLRREFSWNFQGNIRIKFFMSGWGDSDTMWTHTNPNDLNQESPDQMA